jgi:hypothetical protein
MKTKPFLFSAKMLFATFLLFTAGFGAVFLLMKEGNILKYQEIISSTPSIRNYGMGTAEKVQNIFLPYGALSGIALGLIGLLFSSLVTLFLKIFQLGRFRFSLPLALLLGWAPIIWFGQNMVFESARNTALSSGIIVFVGYPLWYTGLVLGILLALLFAFAVLPPKTGKKIGVYLLAASSPIVFSGCDLLNNILSQSCEFFPDKSHCYQESAVGSGDPEECKKVVNKKEFEGTGSNPPRDKCYVMIAENSGDPTDCDDVQGGMFSYSKEECISGALQNGKPDDCASSADEKRCREMYGSKTENCGSGYVWNADANACEKGSAKDPECEDPSFTSQCVGSNSLLLCENGKKSIQTCEFGCFEAWCRETPGETDIAPEPEPEEAEEPQVAEEEPKSDEEEKGEEKKEKEEEEKPCSCKEGEECVDGKCVASVVPGSCSEDTDCKDDQKCMNGACVPKDASCTFATDCKGGEKCVKNACVPVPACKKGDKSCLSPETLEYCGEDGKITQKSCEFGCENSKCLTQKEKEKKDKEKEKELQCKEGYRKCVSDVTLETCQGGFKQQQMCEFGCKSGKCKEGDEKCTGLQRFNPFCEEDDEDIEDKLETDVDTIKDAVTGKYMDLLEEEIDSETDPAKLRGLKKYKEFLDKAGETMETAKTTIDSLKDLKRIFLDSYDPSMDIENMPVDKILKKGFFDKISDSIFGGPTTEAGIEMAEAEDALAVYEKMLERQAEIDFLKQSRMDRLGNVISENAQGYAVDKLKEKAGDIATTIAGDAMIAVSVVDYALTSFQDEAKKQMFVGLARAYNRRRAELEEQFPDANNDQIHRMATEQIQDMPYIDAKGNTFVKYGNLIENKDCQDTSNPLCIDNRVFWTAMDKTYEHTNHKKLFQRDLDQFDRRIQKSKSME